MPDTYRGSCVVFLVRLLLDVCNFFQHSIFIFFFLNDTPTPEIYPLSLPDALPLPPSCTPPPEQSGLAHHRRDTPSREPPEQIARRRPRLHEHDRLAVTLPEQACERVRLGVGGRAGEVAQATHRRLIPCAGRRRAGGKQQGQQRELQVRRFASRKQPLEFTRPE